MTLSPVLRAAGLGLAVAALSLSGALAAAPRLVSSSPAGNRPYGPWPKQIELTFDQSVAQKGLQLDLLDPDGRRIRLPAPVRSGAKVTVTPAPDPLAVDGPYMLSWQAGSTSGDQAKGDFTFFVQQP